MSPTQASRAGAGAHDAASLFDRESLGYDAAHEGRRGHVLRSRMAAVLDAVGPGPGAVLDAGMGPGRLLEELSARGWTVSGVDISERMVALAADRLPHAEGRLIRCSVERMPFEDAGFDAVVATGAIEYVDDPAAAIGELVRVLRPGGLAVVTMPNLSSVEARLTGRLWHPGVRAMKRALPGVAPRPAPYRKPSLMRGAELVRLLRVAGATPVALRHACVVVLPGPFGLIAPGLAARLAQRLEGGSGRAAGALGTQTVVVARKPGAGT